MTKAQKPQIIVVGVDFSSTSELALDRAFDLAAERPQTVVHVVHIALVGNPDSATDGARTEAGKELRRYVDDRVARYAQTSELPADALARVVVHVRCASPAEEIAQIAADLQADLVVVGTHGRRGLARLLIGSVAEGVVRLAPCPVLIVRPTAIPKAPKIEPPCPRCVETRVATAGKEYWCEQHREHHGQRHTYHQDDRGSREVNLPLVFHR